MNVSKEEFPEIMPLTVPESAAFVLDRLRAGGYEGYLVGGCVRDSLLGRAPKDFDVTTDARTTQVEELFADCRVIETGVKHGTVTVIAAGEPIEVTTYRVDGVYSDGRHPDSVAFSGSLEDDLARRDFTVNAMAYAPQTGLVDLYGGAEDLRKGVIRCVGEPERRFGEDALRLLRALRFASVLGFSIEPRTAECIHRMKDSIDRLAKERVTSEFLKLLCGSGAADILREYSDVAAQVMPPLAEMFGCAQNHPCHCYDVWEHTLQAVANVPPDPALRLAALLHDVGKPRCQSTDENGVEHFYGHAAESESIASGIFRECLRIDKKTAARVTLLVKCHDAPLEPSRKVMHRRLTAYGEETLRQLFALQRGDVMGQSPDCRDRLNALDGAERILDELVREQACVTLRDLRVGGNDLMALGVPAGRRLGEILRRLLDEVCEGTLPNEKDALLRRVRELLAEDGGALRDDRKREE